VIATPIVRSRTPAVAVLGCLVAAAGAEASAPREARPVVWVQAGHEPPREPGYRAQTGAASGPFGSEMAFTTRLARVLVTRLRARGVDARRTPARITPFGSRGAVLIGLHHDAAGGSASLGHAISGAREMWFVGEGFGTPREAPFPGSAAHRAATIVPPDVEERSRDLARRLADRYRSVYTPLNGARAAFAGVLPRDGNPRMMRHYTFYRTNADARVLLEAGAGGADDAFLARVGLIAPAVEAGILDHLRARGLLP
jgi:hypothetical protein